MGERGFICLWYDFFFGEALYDCVGSLLGALGLRFCTGSRMPRCGHYLKSTVRSEERGTLRCFGMDTYYPIRASSIAYQLVSHCAVAGCVDH